MRFRLWAVAFSTIFLAGCSSGAGPATETDAAPKTPAEALLARAIAYHDPGGVWGTRPMRLEWELKKPDGSDWITASLQFDHRADSFELKMDYEGRKLDYRTHGDSVSAKVDGSEEISEEDRKTLGLDRENGLRWRNYFGFLAGMPMKLRDPGTILDAEPKETDFEGRKVLALRVTYDPEVGTDTWYFYFDPETAAVVGCRFYHDESKNDGEFMVMEDVVEEGGLRLPKTRRWYVNKDGEFLGADTIASLEVGEGE